MKVRTIEPGATLGAQRGEAVVCIPVAESTGQLGECIRSVVSHTPVAVTIVLCGDDTTGLAALEPAELGEPGRELIHLPGEGQDFATTINAALALGAPADVALLSPDCVVPRGWLERLRDAAYIDGTVATATALSTGGGAASLHLPSIGAQRDLEEAAAVVEASSLRIRPRLETAGRGCVYVRRSALDLVGDLNAGESVSLVEFSERCVAAGLCHVAADDVLVLTDAPAPRCVQQAGSGDPLARSIGSVRRALTGLSVVVDARGLAGPMNGTKMHVLELIAALGRSGEAQITAIVPEELPADVHGVVDALPGVEQTTVANAHRVRADIVHRPFQIEAPADLTTLAKLADRLVITHQDLIGYHNPSYFGSPEGWQEYRRLTRRSLAVSDRVVFFSTHARDDALAEELVEPQRTAVVPIGVDHRITLGDREPVAPPAAWRLADGPEMLLCIGTDFRHKNRVFALRLLEQLQHRHDWDGVLIFAGSRMPLGSSAGEEHRFLSSRPRVREAVRDVGVVSESEKEWLMSHATLGLYPTVQEGFGLVPFEVAEHGVPCLWAPGSSLSELLPDAAAAIVPWDAAASADRAVALIRDQRARAENVRTVRQAGEGLSWDLAARRLIELYASTCDAPPTPASSYERHEGLMRGGLSEDAVRLLGPNGALPRRLERPLLALASHPKLAAPVFRLIEAGYRASRRRR